MSEINSEQSVAPEVIPEENSKESTDVKENSSEEEVKNNPEEEIKNSPLAEQLNRVAQREKYIRVERQKIQEARKAFEEEKQYAENYKAIKGKKDPFEILEHFGITYEQLLEADKERSNPVDPVVKKALEKVEQLELKLSKADKEAEEARIKKAEIQLKADISKVIKEKEFDIIEKLGAEDTVKDYMEEYYNTTGEIPSVEEACQAILDELVNKFSSIKNSKWLLPKEEPKKVEEEEEPKTISNKLTQTSRPHTGAKTAEERMTEALTLLNSM